MNLKNFFFSILSNQKSLVTFSACILLDKLFALLFWETFQIALCMYLQVFLVVNGVRIIVVANVEFYLRIFHNYGKMTKFSFRGELFKKLSTVPQNTGWNKLWLTLLFRIG